MMNDHPAFMSSQICRMRLLDEPTDAASDAGRAMATEAIRHADATKLITIGRNQSPKLQPLWGMVAHNNSIYGALAVYMRLKGIVPPSSTPPPPAASKKK